MAEMSWEEAERFTIPVSWTGCEYAGYTLREIAETDKGLLWLDNKLTQLAPWQKEFKAIRTFLTESCLIQDELARAIRERDAKESGMSVEEYDEQWEGNWLDGN